MACSFNETSWVIQSSAQLSSTRHRSFPEQFPFSEEQSLPSGGDVPGAHGDMRRKGQVSKATHKGIYNVLAFTSGLKNVLRFYLQSLPGTVGDLRRRLEGSEGGFWTDRFGN